MAGTAAAAAVRPAAARQARRVCKTPVPAYTTGVCGSLGTLTTLKSKFLTVPPCCEAAPLAAALWAASSAWPRGVSAGDENDCARGGMRTCLLAMREGGATDSLEKTGPVQCRRDVVEQQRLDNYVSRQSPLKHTRCIIKTGGRAADPPFGTGPSPWRLTCRAAATRPRARQQTRATTPVRACVCVCVRVCVCDNEGIFNCIWPVTR
jgi:hypothetical protein